VVAALDEDMAGGKGHWRANLLEAAQVVAVHGGQYLRLDGPVC